MPLDTKSENDFFATEWSDELEKSLKDKLNELSFYEYICLYDDPRFLDKQLRFMLSCLNLRITDVSTLNLFIQYLPTKFIVAFILDDCTIKLIKGLINNDNDFIKILEIIQSGKIRIHNETNENDFICNFIKHAYINEKFSKVKNADEAYRYLSYVPLQAWDILLNNTKFQEKVLAGLDSLSNLRTYIHKFTPAAKHRFVFHPVLNGKINSLLQTVCESPQDLANFINLLHAKDSWRGISISESYKFAPIANHLSAITTAESLITWLNLLDDHLRWALIARSPSIINLYIELVKINDPSLSAIHQLLIPNSTDKDTRKIVTNAMIQGLQLRTTTTHTSLNYIYASDTKYQELQGKEIGFQYPNHDKDLVTAYNKLQN